MATMMKEDMAALKKDVLALRDELRLKMHLARMDLKSEWERLEPQAEKVWGDMSEKGLEAARELKKRFLAMNAEIKEQQKKH